MTTVFAERREGMLYPMLWASLTLTFVFGFTNYSPKPLLLAMGLTAYLLVGLIFAVLKWVNLVHKIKVFTESLGAVDLSDYSLRHLTHEVFKPMNAPDTMTLPPDPYEFRTRISLWFLFWPSFTVLRPLAHFNRWLSRSVWTFFNNLSKSMYDS